MTKRTLAWIIVAVIGMLSAMGLLFFTFGKSMLTFSESEVQARLNGKLPRTVKDVTIERVSVRLAENRLALRAEVSGTALRQAFSAVATSRGVPRYDAQNGAMYFDADDVRLEQLTVRGRTLSSDEEASTRGRIAEVASSAVRRLVEAAIKAYLAALPVYRFKEDFKGVVLKATVVDIAIRGDRLALTVSLWQLTGTVAALVLALVAVLVAIVTLVRHPFWGLGTIAQIADT
jgi:hypothetical protein